MYILNCIQKEITNILVQMGIPASFKVKNQEDYLLGGRNLAN